MRKLLICCLLLACVQLVKAQVIKPSSNVPKPQSKGGGVLLFERTAHNFGKVMEKGGAVSINFIFTNVGSKPVSIKRVQTTCGCTTPEWPREPILPGSKGRIEVDYDPLGRPGEFNKTLSVATDGEPRELYLTISGEVLAADHVERMQFPFVQGKTRLTTQSPDFRNIRENSIDSMYIGIYNSGERNIMLTGVSTPPHMRLVLPSKLIMPKTAVDVLLYYYPVIAHDIGPRVDEVRLQTNDDTLAQKIFIVKANIVYDSSTASEKERKNPPKFSINTTDYDYGDLYQGEQAEHEFEITNKGKSDLLIRKAAGSCGCTVSNISSPVTVAKGKKFKLRITFDTANLYGRQQKTVTVYTNDPAQPVITLKIKANMVIPGVPPLKN